MSPRRHRSNIAAALLLGSALLSGCGVGLEAQTYQETGRGDGTSVDLETVAIRNLHVEPPTSGSTLAVGSDAILTGTLTSRGRASDTLTTVTTDAAASVTIGSDTLPQGTGAPTPVTIPAGGIAGNWNAVLHGLTTPLRSGDYVTVTLSFTNGGQTTLRVPVRNGDADVQHREVVRDPYGSEG